MDVRQKQALLVVCAMISSEGRREKKKKRVWVKEWSGGRVQPGLSLLQRELETQEQSGFRKLLRMTAEEFDLLLAMVEPLITKQNTKMRLAISPRERLSLTLRFLVTGETFKSLRLQYRIGTSTISQIIMETCAALHRVMKKDFLKTPSTAAEWRTVAQDFDSKWHFPHCLGALECKHIHIQPPGRNSSLYHNYKGNLSLVLMAAVDADYKFIYARVATQSRESDTGPFEDSDLGKEMDRGLLNFPPPEPLPNSHVLMPYMFVGDDTYPLRNDLMKPYPAQQVDHSHRVLNIRLTRARRVAENAFGILVNRLRVLRSTICLEPEKVVKITLASLCIHNFLCGRRSEAYAPPGFADWQTTDQVIVDGAWRNHGTGNLQPVDNRLPCDPTVTAEQQRNLLSDYFVSPAGFVPWQEGHI
ncbi:uncharacterized protein LOC133948982 [Platichthys flesus]|uniref:uncharacterized protein LOC133948982 n=1 Tax=Platichthys flesus TaxID=8260 RepID=UPI001A86244F|nr:uncharacterized protein LOC133948982 [Platichthys flesus]